MSHNEPNILALRVLQELDDAVITVDLDLRVTSWNAAAQRLYGIDSVDAMDARLDELIRIAEPRVTMAEVCREAIDRGSWRSEVAQETAANGRVRIDLSALRLSATELGINGIVLVARDVTERTRSEEALRESERLYRRLAENMTDVVWTADLNLQRTYISPSVKTQRGFTVEEYMRVPLDKAFPPEMIKLMLEALRAELERENEPGADPNRVVKMDIEVFRKDGSLIWVELQTNFIRDGEGKPVGIIGVSRDITERKKAEEALRQSEERFRTLISVSPVGIFLADTHGRCLYVNQRWCEMTGLSPEKAMGEGWIKGLHPDDRERVVSSWKRMIESNSHWGLEYRFMNQEEQVTWVYGLATALHDGQGRIIGFLGANSDITELKAAESALRRSEERFRTLAEMLPEIVYEMDGRGVVTFVNRQAHEITGYTREDFENGFEGLKLLAPEDRERARANISDIMAGKKVGPIEYTAVRKDGSRFPVLSRSVPIVVEGEPIAVRGILLDITEHKRLEEQVQQSRKLQSLGVLAGGIAHDYSNLLQAIMGNIEFALFDLPHGSPVAAHLREAETAVQRGVRITRQMLNYSGKGSFLLNPLDISEICETLGPLLRATISNGIALDFELDKGLPAIDADISQMQQVLLNLVANASEAIGDADGGITVRTGVMDCDEKYLRSTYLPENLSPGKYVCLEVSDTGKGMDEQTIAKAFDPFFTTKFTGRGLGLPSVLGIVRGHKGAIGIRSDPGTGTAFKVLLPVKPY